MSATRVTDRVTAEPGAAVARGYSSSTQEVLRRPCNEYTRLLLDSIPRPGWDPGRIGAARRALATATVADDAH